MAANNTGSRITQGKKIGVMKPPASGHELVASRDKGGILPAIHSIAQAAGDILRGFTIRRNIRHRLLMVKRRYRAGQATAWFGKDV